MTPDIEGFRVVHGGPYESDHRKTDEDPHGIYNPTFPQWTDPQTVPSHLPWAPTVPSLPPWATTGPVESARQAGLTLLRRFKGAGTVQIIFITDTEIHADVKAIYAMPADWPFHLYLEFADGRSAMRDVKGHCGIYFEDDPDEVEAQGPVPEGPVRQEADPGRRTGPEDQEP